MRRATILLRQAVVDRSIKGSTESRDIAIEKFLGELQELFTEKLVNTLTADTLGGMFEDWLSAIGEMSHEERIKALALDVRLCPIPFTMYRKGFVDDRDMGQEVEPAGNIVSLHSR